MSFEDEDGISSSGLASGDLHMEEDDSDSWDETEVSAEQTTCLFCPLQFHTIAVALDHCRTEHRFDLLSLKNKYNMDCYSYIKLINYIRLQKPDPEILTESSTALWQDNVYLKPGEMETWLMYDFDDLGSAPSTPHYAIDGKTPISNINFSDLQKQIQELTMQVKHKDMILENYRIDMEKMKKVTRAIVETEDLTKSETNHVISTASQSTDYFSSYAHFGIHHEMLNDRIRTESYQDAILNNSMQFSEKVVLDVGCGTGILSLFSAKAGAKKVYGVDQSLVVYKAHEISKENKLEEQIHYIKGPIETINLPVDKVDIIVSEWMGYFLLFEGMLESIVHARNTFLKPDGLILPNRCKLSIVGVTDIDRHKEVISFWDDVYGFSMQSMKHDALKEPYIEIVPADKILTNSHVINEIDMKMCDKDACIFSSKFIFTCVQDGSLTAIAGYFDTFFDMENAVEFSTGPKSPSTHWQQTVFYLPHSIETKTGDIIEGSIDCQRLESNPRGLHITINIQNNMYEYLMN